MLRVVAVAQAFKGTLALPTVAGAIEAGIAAAGASADVVRGSDGGTGLLDALAQDFANFSRHQVPGPLGQPVEIPVGWFTADEAVIESGLVIGAALVAPEARDPEAATTRGVGDVLRQVVARGARRVWVGLGGSATMDGGAGLREAWGAEGPRAEIIGLCDVRLPLTGAARFAAQKGADPAMAARIMERLMRLARGRPEADLPGAGAAGGLGFGLAAFLGARLVSGAAWVLDRAGFTSRVARADLVLVTEGAFDATSRDGKLAGVVLERVRGTRAAIVAPAVSAAPPDVLVEAGDGTPWDATALARHVELLVRRARPA